MSYRTYFLYLSLILFSGCSVKQAKELNKITEGKDIITTGGMVVTVHPCGSAAGNEILMKGGNAVDAAVATEFALAVCYPEAGNIGGGGFMLIRMNDGRTGVIDYREKAPLLAAHNMYIDSTGNVIEGMSTNSHLSSGVPGTVDGMIMAHKEYGSLSFNEVIQPAIELAEKGFPVTAQQAEDLNNARDVFISRNARKPVFVKDTEWKQGDTLVQPELSVTLRRIRDHGRDGFYAGQTAQYLLKEMKRGNGIITQKDLDEYKAIARVPLTAEYKDLKIITIPPPSGGGIILIQLLRMIEKYPVKDWEFHSFRTIHLMVEAERRVFADRAQYAGDPEFTDIPVDQLINKKYLAARMENFNEQKASLSEDIKCGSPFGYVSEETTHYSVVDAMGNTVAATTTLNNTFGNGIVADSAGFLLNDEMDDFSVKPGFPNMYGLIGGEANSIRPGKRMLSSMTPVIIEKAGKPYMVLGSPGGSTIPTTVFQVITNVTEFGMNLKQAVDTGRFHHQWLPDWISIEKNAIDMPVSEQLMKMGHVLKERPAIGSVNAIMILPDGKRSGAADKRSSNTCVGY